MEQREHSRLQNTHKTNRYIAVHETKRQHSRALLNAKHYDTLEQSCNNKAIENTRYFRDKSNEMRQNDSKSCLIITNFGQSDDI